MEIKRILAKSLIRDQKTVVKSDAALQDGALFDTDGGTGNPEIKEAANAIMVNSQGDVTILLVRKDSNGDPVEEVMPFLVPGLWHGAAPFRQVKDTGTAPTTVVVGVTDYRSIS